MHIDDNKTDNEGKKWDFEDYAFTMATVLCVSFIAIGILSAIGQSLTIVPEDIDLQVIHRWWPFSWMFFMFAWSACLVKDVVDIKRRTADTKRNTDGDTKKDAANIDHTAVGDLENATEIALYVGITTILLLAGIIVGEMYSSWLAGPIVFVLLAVIWPLLHNKKDKEPSYFPVVPFIILIIGIVIEVVVGGFIAFPVSWILISAIKLYGILRKYKPSENVVVDIMYHAFTIALLATSLIWGSWFISWLAYPASVVIGKVFSKLTSS